MAKRLFWLPLLLSAGLATAAEHSFDFSTTPTGQTPASFRSTLTGQGKPGDWQVILDEVAPKLAPLTAGVTNNARQPVLAQLSRDSTDEHFPLLIYEDEIYGDFSFTTQFKTVRGVAEQMAGPPAAEQTVAKQAMPQEPQCPGSEARSTQAPPQSERPGAQSQAPRRQVERVSQVTPQAPQLAGSSAGSTHWSAQRTSPTGQVTSFWQPERAKRAARAAAARSERVMEFLGRGRRRRGR